MTTLDRLREQAAGVKMEYEQACRNLDAAKSGLEALYASSSSISERMHRKDIETEQARERLSAAEGEAAQCESLAAVLRADVKSTRESMARMLDDIAEQENRVREVQKSIDTLMDLLDVAYSYAATNMNLETMFNLAVSLIPALSGLTESGADSLFEQLRIPADDTWKYSTVNGSSVVQFKRSARPAEDIHNFIYGAYYPAE